MCRLNLEITVVAQECFWVSVWSILAQSSWFQESTCTERSLCEQFYQSEPWLGALPVHFSSFFSLATKELHTHTELLSKLMVAEWLQKLFACIPGICAVKAAYRSRADVAGNCADCEGTLQWQALKLWLSENTHFLCKSIWLCWRNLTWAVTLQTCVCVCVLVSGESSSCDLYIWIWPRVTRRKLRV